MLEELRAVKERNRSLEQKLRAEEQRSKQHMEQIVRLEETIREIKNIGKRNSIVLAGKGEVNKPYHVRNTCS
jgi:pentose-5-phosphate-3-epimerase